MDLLPTRCRGATDLGVYAWRFSTLASALPWENRVSAVRAVEVLTSVQVVIGALLDGVSYRRPGHEYSIKKKRSTVINLLHFEKV